MSDLYTEILNYTKMKFNRDELIDNYAQSIVDGWDLDTLVTFAYDTVVENLNKYSDDKLLEEVEQYSPDLLEEVDAV